MREPFHVSTTTGVGGKEVEIPTFQFPSTPYHPYLSFLSKEEKDKKRRVGRVLKQVVVWLGGKLEASP